VLGKSELWDKKSLATTYSPTVKRQYHRRSKALTSVLGVRPVSADVSLMKTAPVSRLSPLHVQPRAVLAQPLLAASIVRDYLAFPHWRGPVRTTTRLRNSALAGSWLRSTIAGWHTMKIEQRKEGISW
jgi:hypothetical protein